MNKKLIFITCISILLVLTIVSAKSPSTNYETTATARIIGNSPEDMIRQLRNQKIDFEHATYSECTQINNKEHVLNVFKEQFNNNINFVDDNWFDKEDFEEFKDSELIIHRTDTYWTTDPGDSYYIKDLENYLPEKFLLLYDTVYAGLYIPKQNHLILNKFISKSNPIIAPTSHKSDLFFNVFICNLGKYKTLGETFKETRNAYYRNAGKSELLGLTLLSYILYGNPLLKLEIPNKDFDLNEYCKGLVQEYGEQMISSSYNIQKFSTTSSNNNYYIKSVNHQINEYKVDSYENYSILKISGGSLNLDDLDIVLPKLTKTEEFPQNTIITDLTNIKFEDPVELTIKDLPSYEYSLVERKCYENKTEPEVLFSHTYTEDNHEIVVANIYPVKIVDCEQGKLKLYKKVSYDIIYYPYSPIVITNIEVNEKTTPDSLEKVKIHIQNIKDKPVDGTLYISQDGKMLSKLPIKTTKDVYEITFATPKEEGLYNYKIEFFYENKSVTYTSFKLDVKALEVDFKTNNIIKTNTGEGTLILENKFNSNIQTKIEYYLIKNDKIIYSNEKTADLKPGTNKLNLELNNLKREDTNYDLIIKIFYLDKSKEFNTKIYTNTPPVVVSYTYEINEGKKLELNPIVYDTDNDNLEIKTNSKFELDGSYNLSHEDSGEYIIKVKADDGYSESTGEIKLIVNNVNRPPVLEDLEKITVYENELIKLNPVYYDPDNENSVTNDDNTLEIIYPNKFNKNGEWTPNFEESGNYTFYIEVSDGELIDTKELKIEVLNKNRPPKLENLQEIKVKEGDIINLTNISAFDPDNNNNVTNDDNILEFKINSDKFIENLWETNYEDSGVYDIEIEVSDGEFTDKGTVKIIIENTNRPPKLEPFEDITVNENEIVKLNPIYSDPDNENSVTNDDNTLEIIYPNKFNDKGEWQTDYFSAGEYLFEIKVTDGELEDTQKVKVIVNNINRKPVIKDLQIYNKNEIKEGDTILLKGEAEDPDLEDLMYEWYLDNNLIGTTNKNEFSYTFDYRSSGEHKLKLIVEDPYQATDEKEINIKIVNVKVPPLVKDIEDIKVHEGSKVEIKVEAEDYDNEPLRYTINSSKFIKNKNIFIWKTSYKDAGNYTFEIWINNSKFGVKKLVNVFVLDVNRICNLVDYNPKETLYIDEYETVSLNLIIDDPDDIMPEIIWLVNGKQVDKDKETYTFTPNGKIGEFLIKAKIIDGNKTIEKEFTIISMNKPKLEEYDGNTTDFKTLNNLKQVKNFVLEKKAHGKIEFLDEVNLEKDVDFDKYSEISDNLVAIDTNKLKGVSNKKAKVYLYNIKIKNPKIYYNPEFTLNKNEINQKCPPDLCYDIVYKKKEKQLIFSINHFSSFYVKDKGILEIKDVDLKINGKKEDVNEDEEIEIKETDEIELLIEIENSLNIDLEDIELSWRIKGIKDAHDKEEFNIDSGETKKFEYEFDVPPKSRLGKHKLEIELEGKDNENKKYYNDLDAYLIIKKKKDYKEIKASNIIKSNKNKILNEKKTEIDSEQIEKNIKSTDSKITPKDIFIILIFINAALGLIALINRRLS